MFNDNITFIETLNMGMSYIQTKDSASHAWTLTVHTNVTR